MSSLDLERLIEPRRLKLLNRRIYYDRITYKIRNLSLGTPQMRFMPGYLR
jgi:hypothetical protein